MKDKDLAILELDLSSQVPLHQDNAYDPLLCENLGDSIAQAFKQSPVAPLAQLPQFNGVGIYALYYKGDFPPYQPLGDANRQKDDSWAIYVGRKEAENVREGDSQQQTVTEQTNQDPWGRIKSHRESISQAENLELDDFSIKFLALAPVWVPLAEVISIRDNTPVWNTILDGFGCHASGRGRGTLQRSKWDTLHPGRPWAAKLRENPVSREQLEDEALTFLRQRKP